MEIPMRKNLVIGVFVSCLVLTIGAYASPTRQQDSDEALLNQKIDLHLSKATLMHALSKLSVTHRVPIGIEYSAADRNEPKLVLERENVSLKEILDSIVKQEPLYRWQFVDGVINFIPTGERDQFIETLLNTSVFDYDPGRWTTKFQLRDAIGDTPEVKKLLQSYKMELAKYRDYPYSDSIYTKKEVDLKMSHATVKQILNRIVKISEHKSWAIGRRQNEDNVFSIWL
jgi:hypothetical protein